MSAISKPAPFLRPPIRGKFQRAGFLVMALAVSATCALAQAPATDNAAPVPSTPTAAPEQPAIAQPAPPADQPVPSVSTPAPSPAAPTTSRTPLEPTAAPPASPAPTEPPTAETAEPQPRDIFSQFLEPERRSDLPHDLSPWGMFMAADWVVKAVMMGLAFASLVTWTVWVAKTLELAGARTRAGRALKIIRDARTLAEALDAAGNRGGPAVHMLRAAAEEINLSEAAVDHAGGDGVKERVASVLSRIEAYAGRRMSRGTGMLATIGSTAPFVGLFGTVWGIMNSFIGISQAQTTNLAVVAPGIAEALLATAIGLVAAIPAVVIYNVFARSVTGYRQLLADAAAGVERLVSRDLDFRKVPPGALRAPVSLVAGG